MKTLAALMLMGAVMMPSLAVAADTCAVFERACQMKDQLGERGEGNCKKARACVRQCAALRQACLFKGERGERGEGNCRRYRETCKE